VIVCLCFGLMAWAAEPRGYAAASQTRLRMVSSSSPGAKSAHRQRARATECLNEALLQSH
jgi:hypothetical protein